MWIFQVREIESEVAMSETETGLYGARKGSARHEAPTEADRQAFGYGGHCMEPAKKRGYTFASGKSGAIDDRSSSSTRSIPVT